MSAYVDELQVLATSQIAIQVRRRVIRQLLESLLHEGIVTEEEATKEEAAMFFAAQAAVSLSSGIAAEQVGARDSTGSHAARNGKLSHNDDAVGTSVAVHPYETEQQAAEIAIWKLIGWDERRQRVAYYCRGRRMMAFGRYRIMDTPVLRAYDGQFEEAASSAQLLSELLANVPNTEDNLAAFIHELEQTWLHDAFLLMKRERGRTSKSPDQEAKQLSYDELEGEMAHGHPYHPSYKSRIGFTLDDQVRYAPDLKPTFSLFWVGLRRDWAYIGHSATFAYEALLESELGEELIRMKRQLPLADRDSYVIMPVHPWQWREVIAKHYFPYMQAGILIPLGKGDDSYRPQASIRTLSNVSYSGKCQVKTSLSIVNTSAKRIIQPYHAKDASVISDWLHSLLEADSFLKEVCGLVLLRERAGVSFRYDRLPAPLAQTLHGSLGALWRESLMPHLREGEQALPYTAVSEKHAGMPYIAAWLTTYGVERWFRQLLRVTLQPLLHLLYAYGVGVEAHAQNMVLLHRDGWPMRAVLRDLPGGIRCLSSCPDYPVQPELTHSTYLATDEAEHVRDYWVDAILHIHLYEWALLLHEEYGLAERQFWHWAAETIMDYQEQFPQHAEGYVRFDLFAKQVEVGELASRKVYGEGGGRDQVVDNPLHTVRQELVRREVRA